MKSELVEAGLYIVERLEGRCIIETRVCSSPLLWSGIVGFIIGSLTIALGGLAWVLPKLPPSAIPVALVVLVPAVLYWWRFPWGQAKQLALFSRTLEIDREVKEVRYSNRWVFGLRTGRRWDFGEISEVVSPTTLGWMAFKFKDGETLLLDGGNFYVPELLSIASEYMPDLGVRRV